LEERMPWGIWCDGLTPEEERETKSDNQGGEKCAYIDDEGFAYEEAPSSSGALVVKIRSDTPGVPVGSAAADPLLMRDMRFFGKEIASVTGSSFVEYRFFSHLPRQLELVSSEGFTLMVSREGDLANTLRVLKKVLEEEIKDQRSRLEYIDLRLGSKVFYKFK